MARSAGSGRRYRTAVARDDAIDQARRKAVELRAIRDGLIAAPEPEPEVAPKTTIGDAIDAYLRYVKMQRKPRTHLTYRYTLDTLLRASYKKKYVEDATRDDVLDFMTYCYEQGLGARTVYDKVVTVLQLFKKHGRSGLMEKGDWPNYVDTIRPIYEPEELTAMFKVATEDEADTAQVHPRLRLPRPGDPLRRVSGPRLSASRCARDGETEVGLYAEELGGARRAAARRFDRAAEKAERGAQRQRPHDLVFGQRPRQARQRDGYGRQARRGTRRAELRAVRDRA